MSVVRVLRRLGVEVSYPEGQTCCGQPAFNSGFFGEAKNVAHHFLDVFEKEPAEHVVYPSGSCAAMVSHYYPFLFEERGKEERDRYEALAGRVRELSDFLVNVLGVQDVGASLPGRAVFHTGCYQQRNLGSWRSRARYCATYAASTSSIGRTRSCAAASAAPSPSRCPTSPPRWPTKR